MITYFDASALAKRYIEEEHSAEVVRRLDETTPVVCRLTEVEIASAVARRSRERVISSREGDRILATLDEDFATFHVVELSREVVTEARATLLRHRLRAADSLQLAAALVLRDRLQGPIAFLTFDDRLAEASASEGLPSPQDPES